MVFSSLFFLFVFLPCFILCYTAARTLTLRNAVLVVASLVFYAWGEPVYVLLMLASVAVNYLVGLAIGSADGWVRKVALTVGVTVNVATLGVFKYAGLVCDALSACGIPMPHPEIALPIGISFYTFQGISYLADVYQRKAQARHRFSDVLLYISMFPQLIAGPIVRFDTIANEISCRRASVQDLVDGSYRFIIGLAKKVILANQLSEVADQFLAGNFADLSTSGAWLGLLAFSLQIYFDFSGYSDMAIGMGRCMGFHFNENFNHPYCCSSITDFWRRWHISLGSFFRDYVYIPLGGNRRHQWFNLAIVWFITGLWHGAAWNFVLWGLYFGVLVIIEKYTLFARRGSGMNHNTLFASFFRHGVALLLVYIGWAIFYFDDLGRLGAFFLVFIGQGAELHSIVTELAVTDRAWLWLAAIVLCLPVRSYLRDFLGNSAVVVLLRACIAVALLCICTVLLVGATNNAFIYTRF